MLIVNAPEVAILGVVRSKMAPMWDGKAFQPRLMAAAAPDLRPSRHRRRGGGAFLAPSRRRRSKYAPRPAVIPSPAGGQRVRVSGSPSAIDPLVLANSCEVLLVPQGP